MKKVLVTGATGFIGSHLTEKLVELGFCVKVFLHYNSQNQWGWLDHSEVKNNIEVISGDIRDYDLLCNAVKNSDAVFHLAALIGIPYSYLSPKAYIMTNVVGTYNILQASLEHKIDNLLITSTSETYGTAQYVPIDEKHPLRGQSPYSATKIAADELARSYHLSFGLPLKIVRPFNTYGPRQSNRAIIPTIICQIISGSKEIKLGNLNPTRDLNYVKDTVNGFINIFQSSSTIGKVINIAQNTEYSIGEVVNQIQKIMGTELPVVIDDDRLRPDNSEVFRLFGDNSRLKKLTDWKPNYTLEKGLQETILWLEKNIEKYKLTRYGV